MPTRLPAKPLLEDQQNSKKSTKTHTVTAGAARAGSIPPDLDHLVLGSDFECRKQAFCALKSCMCFVCSWCLSFVLSTSVCSWCLTFFQSSTLKALYFSLPSLLDSLMACFSLDHSLILSGSRSGSFIYCKCSSVSAAFFCPL